MKLILLLVSTIICQSCSKEFECKCTSSIGESYTTVNSKNKKNGKKACEKLTFPNNESLTVYGCELNEP